MAEVGLEPKSSTLQSLRVLSVTREWLSRASLVETLFVRRPGRGRPSSHPPVGPKVGGSLWSPDTGEVPAPPRDPPSQTLGHKTCWPRGLERDRGKIGRATQGSHWTRRCGAFSDVKAERMLWALWEMSLKRRRGGTAEAVGGRCWTEPRSGHTAQ